MGTRGNILYKLDIPLLNEVEVILGKETKDVCLGNQIRFVKYFIENYQENSKYTEMRLRFPELDYFIPSAGRITLSSEKVVFARRKETLYRFPIKYRDTTVSVSFDIKTEEHINIKATAETISEVSLEFPETDDLDYLVDLHFSVRDFFVFVCNRQNLGLRSAILIGNAPRRIIIVNDKIKFTQSYKGTLIAHLA